MNWVAIVILVAALPDQQPQKQLSESNYPNERLENTVFSLGWLRCRENGDT